MSESHASSSNDSKSPFITSNELLVYGRTATKVTIRSSSGSSRPHRRSAFN